MLANIVELSGIQSAHYSVRAIGSPALSIEQHQSCTIHKASSSRVLFPGKPSPCLGLWNPKPHWAVANLFLPISSQSTLGRSINQTAEVQCPSFHNEDSICVLSTCKAPRIRKCFLNCNLLYTFWNMCFCLESPNNFKTLVWVKPTQGESQQEWI